MASQELKKIYFTAGPAKIPDAVMKQVHAELLNYKGLDISVMELSHRSKDFEAIINETEANLRKLLKIPDNYSVLFLQGGAKTQFDSVPMNICSKLGCCKTDYIVNGTWSKMAADDAAKYTQVERQLLKSDKFDRLPRPEELVANDDACYRFYCDNETIQGVEYNYVPSNKGQTLVCDMTSNFLSRPVDVSKFGIIFAGAQKNCGVSGLCMVIVRNDLIGNHMPITPTIQNYQVMKNSRSLYNTPLTFAIYVANLCIKWMLDQGGLEVMDSISRQKSRVVYETIDNSKGFYTCPIAEGSRSRMNVTFLLSNDKLNSEFLAQSQKAGLYELKGHRSVGGFRASLYHGVTMDDVQRLVNFMKGFQKDHSV